MLNQISLWDKTQSAREATGAAETHLLVVFTLINVTSACCI